MGAEAVIPEVVTAKVVITAAWSEGQSLSSTSGHGRGLPVTWVRESSTLRPRWSTKSIRSCGSGRPLPSACSAWTGDQVCPGSRTGSAVQLGRGGALFEPAGLHHGDPVHHRQGLLLVVGDEQGGDAELLLEQPDLLAQGQPHLGVERGERLVEEQHARAQGEGAGRGHALLLSAGELVREPCALVCEAHQLQQLGGPGTPFGGAHLAHPQPEGHVAERVEVREEAVRLEHHPGVATVGRHPGDVLAVDQHLAGVGVFEPGEHPQRGGLAAAGGAQQGEEFTRPDGEVEAVLAVIRAGRAYPLSHRFWPSAL